MAEQAIKDKIYDVLKSGFFRDATDFVDVSDGPAGEIHVVVVSRKFDGRRAREKRDLVQSELIASLKPEEWEQVLLTIAVSPEQVKAVG